MKGVKKIENDVLIDSYKRHGNVWKVGKELGIYGQNVHYRLTRLGVIKKMNVFTEEDMNVLRREYISHRNDGNIQALADRLGRTKQFICRQAGKIGLTDISHNKSYLIKDPDCYYNSHYMVRKHRGQPSFCEVCKCENEDNFYEWANMTGDYNNIYDYKRMCRKCHRAYDKDRKMLAHIKPEVKNGQAEPAQS